MVSRRSGPWFVSLAPAKLNLFFEICARRADGYHEILSCVCPIGWYDTIWFRPADGDGLRFSCRWIHCLPPEFPPGDLPSGGDNLVYKALELLREYTSCTQGAECILIKSIPSGSGLGGASSDAAAVLRLANWAWGLGLTGEQLSQLAATLGSDVPFFFADGLALCQGRGEVVRPLGTFPLHLVVVRPPAALSTAEMYRIVSVPAEPREIEPFLHSLQAGRVDQLGRLVFNRFQPLAKGLCPWIARLEDEFSRLDVLGHAMSGSGTAYFGLCRSATHARRIAGYLRTRGVGLVWAGQSCRGIACWVEESFHGDHRSSHQACR